jgi:hypothetical protein
MQAISKGICVSLKYGCFWGGRDGTIGDNKRDDIFRLTPPRIQGAGEKQDVKRATSL